MKKLLAGLLIAGMVMSMFGCGQQDNPTASEQPKAADQAADVTPAADAGSASMTGNEGRIEIEYWHKNSETAGGPTIEEYAKQFNESQDKYTIKPVFMTEDYKGIMQQLQAEAAAGNAPGVIQVGYYWINYLADNHQFVDINTLDAGYLDNYLPNIVELCTTSDGKVAGIPYSLSTPVMYYNKELLAKAGLDTENLPKTVDELYDWARTVKEKSGEYGLAMAAASDFWLEQWEIESNGGRMLETQSDGTVKAAFASEQGIQALQDMSDLINKDKAAAYVLGEAIKEAFTSGKIAMIGATIGWSTGIKDGANFDFVTGPMPVYGDNQPRVPVGGNFLAITAPTPEEQQGAWEWIQYITTQEAHVDWTKATGYVPPRKDVSDMPEFQDYLKEAPQLQACLDQMENLVPFVSFPGDSGLEIEQSLLDTRDSIMNGDQTAQEALTAAQDQANELMGE
ncbi:ABC transporter substrate-binding protein [Diplocloster modestus]|uniref:ABC transporter substrate-binding protein n=1 Tax=Diplocloster modestus TaxID=2850322 RepID=A0ABS6K4V5_9FIRM|nr:ABC transporter substrate-binding protein [Diplocloster modestus]MBU9725528.1 ABC transporter substrate-binding protein [Diplocloster modestus]